MLKCFVADIIFEDNHIVVVIKPQNVSYEDVLADLQTTGYCASVHRLDQVTGGVMVFARSSKAAARLSAQIAEGGFEKIYLAVLNGTPKNRTDTLVNYLLKNEAKGRVEVVPMATVGAKRAELTYTVLPKAPISAVPEYITKNEREKEAKEAKEGATSEERKPLPKSLPLSVAEIKLGTGRTHQIRVQMANIGCPVFGDARYGGDKLGKGWNLALWAHKLAFKHPVNEDTMRFVVNPPEIVPWTSFDFDRQSHKNRQSAIDEPCLATRGKSRGGFDARKS